MTCSNCSSELCNLKFYAEVGELEDTFGHITVQDSEEQVAQKQVEEDLRIYGTRHEPSDAVDLGEDEKLSKLPPKRSASEFEAGIDRPAKARKKSECRTFNYENVTAMDWNAGESPMMAWVNQSAVPAAIPIDTSKTDPSVSKDEELLEQEKQEIEIFKNVHVTDALVPAHSAKFAAGHECRLDLDLGAQIYYRNIVDRYPLLPPYLARRLAIANHNRAERLHSSRLRNSREMEVPSSLPSNNGPSLESQSDAVDKYINTRRMSSEWVRPPLAQYESGLESQSDAVHQNFHQRQMSWDSISIPSPKYPQYGYFEDSHVSPSSSMWSGSELARLKAQQAGKDAQAAHFEAQKALLEAEQACLAGSVVPSCEACFDNNRVSSCHHTGRYSQELR